MAETANELVTEQDELQPYYEDVIQLFTEAKDDKPFNFIATYFENVAAQQHVLFRRFEYISLTIHNRNSFIFQFSSIFESFYTHKVMVTGDEIHQLLCLLCPDFPSSLIYLALAIIDVENSKSYSFVVIAEVVLNVFLYWDILQHIQTVFVSKTKPKEEAMEHREYVFIGEIRTAIFEFQLQHSSKEELCHQVLCKLKSYTDTNKVKLLDLCKAVTE